MCEKVKKVEKSARNPAVAGSFYPSSNAELSQNVKEYLLDAPSFKPKDISAIVVPHAGYVFSAPVAAISYKTLHKSYKNIFIIGSSHHLNFNGISVYTQGDYQTPLGKVKVNTEILRELMDDNPSITYKKEAHLKEHTLEVQLPFLQTLYGDKLSIVPIVIASSELETIKRLAKSLKPYFNDDNLFIISTDLSHYPSYEDANSVDMQLLEALSKNTPDIFINSILQNEESKINNLQTSACGWSSLLTLLYLTQNKDYTYEILKYKNSGDTKYGDKEKVVGYGAMRIYKNHDDFSIQKSEKELLLNIVKQALHEAVVNNKRLELDPNSLPPKLKEHLGAFVTLHLNSKLKGCIGRFEPDQPLYEVVVDMSIAASRHDTRFTPLTKEELADTSFEISLLTPRKRVFSIDDVEVGKHGIYVKYGSKSGTYLPHVATQMHWDKEEFFKSCCEDKAGISPQNCKDAELYTFEAIIF